ncbi:hypothetical protein BU24DRAFT_192611 [Aaosphaeria arxii CBS 175.79]|uniref:Uncharacterized protein n=1 Tax=Aaosphaeria arxii CBS 175.79 TaxID=1450172 RepID=A0A6A5XT30_9PLEO|nr:uncharacterized protein BU24DRAFT_192611 [Aaosphaeria arxii CBS 175.79]KAF2016069.1 hypothetical protein BU24DRAFT_192611 [Aaosphaeria arxii CBS 175.79]
MVNLFRARRKSAGNILDEVENEKLGTSPEAPAAGSSAFKVLSQTEIAAKKELAIRKQHEKEKSKFGRFSGFGGTGNKSRQQSLDDESPGSSKRDSDSKSSSGTQSSSNRPYHTGQFGSTSTLPSSADTDPNDNMFANLPPRPTVAQHNSSPSGFSISGMKKALPQIPHSKTHDVSSRYYGAADGPVSQNMGDGRPRAMTTSSYASTAIPPKLDSDLNFGSGFDDLFSGLDKRRDSPDFMDNSPGRSLLAGKRVGQPEPIDINRKLEVEPALASWDSRGSGDNLIPSPTEDNEDNNTPPPVPPHKYAPITSRSPGLGGAPFQDAGASVRESTTLQKSLNQPESEQKNYSFTSSTPSLQTPLSSRTGSDSATPKAALRTTPLTHIDHNDDDNLFTPSPPKETPVRKTINAAMKDTVPAAPQSASVGPGRKVMTAAEFQAHKTQQMARPADDSSDSEDYEDEEDAIRQREEEELRMRKKQQQMQIAREALRRSTTAPIPSNVSNRPESFVGGATGFPSEASLQADQWDDEDVPLGMLAQHLPVKQNLPLSQNPTPSYLPDRPASAGAASNRASQAYRPVFARNLPEDPYLSQFVGGGLVRQGNRESMGFNRAASVYGEPVGGSMPYADAPQFPTLVGQIQMRESAKPKYLGGASSKIPTEGPFTGALGAQMNGMNQPATRMSQMPMQQGMGMMNMMNGGMMGMGMGQGMSYPMQNQSSLMQDPQYQQMQQMIMAQQSMLMQMQAQQAGMFGQQMPQDPRMSMFPQQMQGFQNPSFANNSTPNLGSLMQNQRPMSIMSGFGNQQPLQQSRPYSAVVPGAAQGPGQFPQHLGPGPGYTASIAPSERSNIGMSSRYRPVTTGNGMQDHMSSVSSQTLQPPSANVADPRKVKGILKNKVNTQVSPVREDDEEDWSKLRERKNKFASNTGGGAKDNTSATSAFDEFDARVVF